MPFGIDGMDAEDRQRYIMAGGNVADLPPPKDGVDEAEFGLYNWGQGRQTGGQNTGGFSNGMNFNAMPFMGEDLFEDFLPFANFGTQPAAHTTQNTGSRQTNGRQGPSFLPFMMDGEDRAQYEMFKRGIMTADFDPAEIAKYSAWARAEGVQVPTFGGASQGSRGSRSTGGQTNSNVGSGDRHSDNSQPARSNTQPAQNQPAQNQPVHSNPFGGWFPFMGMDSEDMAQYQMYRNGIYSPDMDMGEIAQYRMFDQFNRNSAPHPHGFMGGLERRRKL